MYIYIYTCYLRTKNVNFRGSDSGGLLIVRVGIPLYIHIYIYI